MKKTKSKKIILITSLLIIIVGLFLIRYFYIGYYTVDGHAPPISSFIFREEVCVLKDCEDLAIEGKTCLRWSDGCVGVIDCGECISQCGKDDRPWIGVFNVKYDNNYYDIARTTKVECQEWFNDVGNLNYKELDEFGVERTDSWCQKWDAISNQWIAYGGRFDTCTYNEPIHRSYEHIGCTVFGRKNCISCPSGNYENGQCEPIQAISPFENHIIITCSPECQSVSQYSIGACMFTMTYDLYGGISKTKDSYDKIINYFGGYNQLISLDYPFPDINVEYICEGNQHYTPSRIYVKARDEYGTTHEMFHHMIRFYTQPSLNFYSGFEEGLAHRISWCTRNPQDPCCDLNKVECIVPEDVCKPGIGCNFQGLQTGMIIRLTGEYGCDINNCWKAFFKDLTENHAGEKLTTQYTYLWLNKYTGKDVYPLLKEYKIKGLKSRRSLATPIIPTPPPEGDL